MELGQNVPPAAPSFPAEHTWSSDLNQQQAELLFFFAGLHLFFILLDSDDKVTLLQDLLLHI